MAYYGDQQQPQVVQPQVVQPPPFMMPVQQNTNINNIVPETKVSMAIQMVEYATRGLSILFALIAVALMGSAKETIGVLLYVEFGIKFSKYSALKYFVAANAIVMFLSIGSLVLSIILKSKYSILKLVISVVDLIALSLLLTANGAASAASAQFDDIDHLFGSEDSDTTCQTYKHFCGKVKASIFFSFLAVFVYLVLICVSLYKKNK